jgi:XTP/dITP diphosphohydrolase
MTRPAGKTWEIVVGSRNPGKVREIRGLLEDLPVHLRSLSEFPDLPMPEETGTTFLENAEIKALTLASSLRSWVLADDSGLEVDALGGAPGVFSARYAGQHGDDSANNRRLLRELAQVPEERRTARFRCVVVLAAPGQSLLVAEGSCEGRIAFAPRGNRGFGYDPVFYYPPEGQTFGELGDAVKNRVSHRGQALSRLRQALRDLLAREGT